MCRLCQCPVRHYMPAAGSDITAAGKTGIAWSGCVKYQNRACQLLSRYSIGETPVQRLKARVKLLGSEKPSR